MILRGSHFGPLTWASGGGEGTRTLGLYIANVALFQLSYTPAAPVQNSRADAIPRFGEVEGTVEPPPEPLLLANSSPGHLEVVVEELVIVPGTRIPGRRGVDERGVRWLRRPHVPGPPDLRSPTELLLGLEFLGVGHEPDESQGCHPEQPGEHPGQVHPRKYPDDAGRDGNSPQAAHQDRAPVARVVATNGWKVRTDLRQTSRLGAVQYPHTFIVCAGTVIDV